MSDTTPDASEPKPETVAPEADAVADADVADPPSSPVSARGHVNHPGAGTAPADETVASAPQAPQAPPAPEAPARAIEPEPVVATDDDIAAAVARSSTGDVTAAGTATVDTASPAESAAPLAAAAAAVEAPATAAYPAPAAPVGEATWAPDPAVPVGAPQPAYAQPVTPIFVQRPEPPKKKSNRGFGILIALVGTIVFAVLWVAAVVLIGYWLTPGSEFLHDLNRFFLAQTAGWVPIVAFFVGMVVLIQIVNRARWWAYTLGGLFVAVFVYFAFVGASVLDAGLASSLNSSEISVLLARLWLSPFAVIAGVIAREISMWTGAWLAARGRKLKVRNAEALADYDQQLADAQNQAVAAYASPQQSGY
ncbi:hypothetical protein [Leifsonia poae]|uniref:hypothetical protein n=1 Tax=Leifsonia poae TaxID=110933 RepID=UPI001CBB0F0B|nr:hypothetical protein [Leifsonia poae]